MADKKKPAEGPYTKGELPQANKPNEKEHGITKAKSGPIGSEKPNNVTTAMPNTKKAANSDGSFSDSDPEDKTETKDLNIVQKKIIIVGGKRRLRIKKRKRIKVKRRRALPVPENTAKQQHLQNNLNLRLEEEAQNQERAAIETGYADQIQSQMDCQKTYVEYFVNTMRVSVLVGRIFFRYPVQSSTDSQGKHFFSYNPCSISAVIFLIINVLLTILFIVGVVVVFSFWVDIPVGIEINNKYLKRLVLKYAARENSSIPELNNQTFKELQFVYLRNRPERYIFDRHIVMFVSMWSFLCLNILCGWHTFVRREYIVKYYNFWLKAICIMGMDVTIGALKPVCLCVVVIAVIGFVLTVMSLTKALPSTVGSSAFIAAILGRMFTTDLFVPVTAVDKKECQEAIRCLSDTYYFLSTIGGIIQAYLYFSWSFYLLQFLIICRYLKTAFAEWNSRVYSTLLRGRNDDFILTKEGRTIYGILFKDHCTLLDLMDGTNRVFTIFIEAFSGLATLCVCLELYLVIRTGFTASADNTADNTTNTDTNAANKAFVEGYHVRSYDIVVATFLILLHLLLLTMALKISANVGIEAMEGLEIIRRKTILGRKTDEELYFILSIFSSFTAHRPIALSGGGFVICNKQYLLGVAATIISYFTILLQFKPNLDYKREHLDLPWAWSDKYIKAVEKPVF